MPKWHLSLGGSRFTSGAAVLTGRSAGADGTMRGQAELESKIRGLHHSTTRSRNWVTRVGLGSKVSHSVDACGLEQTTIVCPSIDREI